MPTYDVILKKVPAMRVDQVRGVAPTLAMLGPTLDRLFDQVENYIRQQGATNIGPGITVYYDQEFCEQDISVGACLSYEGSVDRLF